MATQLFGTTFSKDDYGVSTFIVPFYCEDAEEAADGALPSPVAGLAETPGKRAGRQWEGGGYVVTAVFEGITGSFDEDENNAEFDSSFKHADIRGHPNLQKLLNKYGGTVQDDGTITWPLVISSSSGSGFGSSKSASTKNPMFGNESYLELGAVFRNTQIKRSMPSDLLDRIGQIKKSLPDGLPTPANRDWLIFPPRAYVRGSVIQVVNEWLLGPVGGWPEVQELLVL